MGKLELVVLVSSLAFNFWSVQETKHYVPKKLPDFATMKGMSQKQYVFHLYEELCDFQFEYQEVFDLREGRIVSWNRENDVRGTRIGEQVYSNLERSRLKELDKIEKFYGERKKHLENAKKAESVLIRKISVNRAETCLAHVARFREEVERIDEKMNKINGASISKDPSYEEFSATLVEYGFEMENKLNRLAYEEGELEKE